MSDGRVDRPKAQFIVRLRQETTTATERSSYLFDLFNLLLLPSPATGPSIAKYYNHSTG